MRKPTKPRKPTGLSEPPRPKVPNATIKHESYTLEIDETIRLSEIDELLKEVYPDQEIDRERVEVRLQDDWECIDVSLVYPEPYETDNPHFSRDVARYGKAIEKYQEKYRQWQEKMESPEYEKYLKDLATYEKDLKKYEEYKTEQTKKKLEAEINKINKELKKLEQDKK